jgi:CTP:molybdopterin cytidylyltransferase MocA
MTHNIYAIILAAGQSRRIHQLRLLLPWGISNVLGQLLLTFSSSGGGNILMDLDTPDEFASQHP